VKLRFHKTSCVFISVLWLISLFPGNTGADLREIEGKIGSRQKALKKVQRSIAEKKAALRKFAKQEKGLLSQIQALDRRLLSKEEQLESYDLSQKEALKEREQLKAEIEEIQKNLERFRAYLSYKVIQLYKYGGYSYVKALFTAGSYTDLLKQYRYVKLLAEEDRKILLNYQKVYTSLKPREKALAGREEKIRTLRKASKEKNREILAEREERSRLLKEIRSKKSAQKRLLAELNQSAASLQETITELIRQRDSLFGDFKHYKGHLSWPVEGEVVTEFGKHKHSRFNTYIFSNGIDIAAKSGDKVHAIYKGTVLFADWFKGYGQMVILDHGKGFYSVYAHLSRILVSVKEKIKQGQEIGKVGETGSLNGPLLYFEIRYHGIPQNPTSWLAAR